MPSTARTLAHSLLVTVLVGCGGAGSPSRGATAAPTVTRSPEPAATPRPAASVALPDPVNINDAGALAIRATPGTDWVVLVDGKAWVAGTGAGIGVFDATGELVESIAIGGWCAAMDTGFGAVWSATCEPSGLVRIDATTQKVDRIKFEEPIPDSEASVGAGEGAVWVVVGHQADTLLGIDPESLEISHRFPIPIESAAVRAGLGAVWVTRPFSNELLRVDPASGETVAIPVGPAPRFLALGEGAVWVMNQRDGSVSRIDPATATVVATIDVGRDIRGGDIAVGGGSVWVRGGPELLARIDPATNRVTERYGPDAGSGSVAADDDAVWITAHDVETIWRLPLR